MSLIFNTSVSNSVDFYFRADNVLALMFAYYENQRTLPLHQMNPEWVFHDPYDKNKVIHRFNLLEGYTQEGDLLRLDIPLQKMYSAIYGHYFRLDGKLDIIKGLIRVGDYTVARQDDQKEISSYRESLMITTLNEFNAVNYSSGLDFTPTELEQGLTNSYNQ